MKVLLALLILFAIPGCGGDVSVNQNQDESTRPSGEPGSIEDACVSCLGNGDDGLTDSQCLAQFNLTLADCF